MASILPALDAKTVGLLVALAGSAGNCVGGAKAAPVERQDATLAWVQVLEARVAALEDSLRLARR